MPVVVEMMVMMLLVRYYKFMNTNILMILDMIVIYQAHAPRTSARYMERIRMAHEIEYELEIPSGQESQPVQTCPSTCASYCDFLDFSVYRLSVCLYF